MKCAVFSMTIITDVSACTSVEYELGNRTCKAYAERIGADYILDTEQTIFKGRYSPHVQKLRAYDMLEKEYDRILYLGSDVLVKPDAPDIFKTFPDVEKLYMYNENFRGSIGWRIYNNIFKVKPEYRKYVVFEHPQLALTPYYNSDVALISRSTRAAFCQDDYFQGTLWEQDFINWNIHRFNVSVEDIGLLWNGMLIKCESLKLNYHDQHFLHYGGRSRPILIEDYKKYYG